MLDAEGWASCPSVKARPSEIMAASSSRNPRELRSVKPRSPLLRCAVATRNSPAPDAPGWPRTPAEGPDNETDVQYEQTHPRGPESVPESSGTEGGALGGVTGVNPRLLARPAGKSVIERQLQPRRRGCWCRWASITAGARSSARAPHVGAGDGVSWLPWQRVGDHESRASAAWGARCPAL